MSPAIQHDPVARRFRIEVEGHACVLDYELDAGVMTITHTGVPEAVAWRGIAAALTQAAMDVARARHWKVVPRCSCAAVWMRRHPDSQDLLA